MEQAKKHTPGKWLAVRDDEEALWRIVGTTPGGLEGCYSVAEVIDGNGHAQNAANKDLILAAPALLAELHECQAALSALLGGDPDLISRICGSTTLGNRLAHLRAAIASAVAP